MRRMWKHLKNKKGFTLMEAVLAIAIVGIIAAIVMPLLSNAINTFKAASALQKTASDTEYKNATANNDLTDIYVTVKLDTNGGGEKAESRFKFSQATTQDGKYDIEITYYELKKGDETK